MTDIQNSEYKEKNNEPITKDDEKQSLEYFISQPLKLADRFMQKIYKDDSFYMSSRYALTNDAKSLYLYGSVRQVKKVSLSILLYKDFVQGPIDKDADTATLRREIIESVHDVENYWIRKLIEILTNLICFQETDLNEVYMICQNIENLELFLGKQHDLKEFYQCESKNIEESIKVFYSRISNGLEMLNNIDLWFINRNNLNKRKLPIFSSTKNRFKKAIKLATDDEKLVLGISYHQMFSRTSLSIHGLVSSTPHEINFDIVKKNIGHISILSQRIISKANKLMGFSDNEDIENILGKNSNAKEMLNRYKINLDVGDLVLAYNDLAEITEMKESQYGYRSYKVRYVNSSPLPEIIEDWFPSENIVRLMSKTNVKGYYDKYLKNLPSFKNISFNENTEKNIFEAVKRVYIDLDKKGILLPILFNLHK